MVETKQVDRVHYEFARYMGKDRWNSVWHQLDEVSRLAPASVLEIGPGPGLFKVVARQFGLRVETLDLDSDLQPDHLGSATALPFADGAYDLVCAFQMLEHMPYEQTLKAFEEMVRVARRNVVISLPDAAKAWRYHVHLPRIGTFEWLWTKPFQRSRPHVFDGEHHWEINKRGYELARVISDLSARCKLTKTYRVQELAYHRFFVFER